ncbi:MAG TPA: nitroreductase family protein [Acidimicrobiia bacterium]|jgi:nitroreductase|nr:nitroreductase family protein [Acidimicrobiia bacterium]HIL05896.1 nitroreductase family protein [Acidimicrobiia bacterium]
MNDIYQMMSTLRAVRRLRSDPIPDDVLDRVLQAAAWAPTGGNMQPWRVVVVRSAERKQALADVYRPAWYSYAKGYDARIEALPSEEAEKARRNRIAGDYLADHIQEAPVILMFVADPKMMAITDAKLDRISMVGGGSVYTAIQNAMLAARTEGLGCVLTTLHCLAEDEVKAALQIPEGWATLGMVPLGYPIGKGHGPISRQPASILAYDDVFGAVWR